MTKPEIVGSTRVVRMVCEEKGIDYTMMPRCLLAFPRLRGKVARSAGWGSPQRPTGSHDPLPALRATFPADGGRHESAL